MKKCTRCGALQDDSRTMCVDCSNPLPSPMSEEERLKCDINLSDKLADMTDKTDDFYISPKRKLVIVLDILGIALCMMLDFTRYYGKDEAVFCLLAALIFVMAAAIKGLPRLFWKLERFRLSFIINEEYMVTPTDRWLIGNTIAGYSLTIFGYLFLFYIYTL